MSESNLLETLRADPGSWDTVSFSAGQSEERGIYDKNRNLRNRILLSLQYDRRDTDANLVRHLFAHEILAAENDSSQGFGDAFTLAAILLASYRDPADVPLFARAKLANFDTACGFPMEFMYIAGGHETERILRDRSPSLWDKLSDNFSKSDMASEDLEEWWASVNDDYPNAMQDEQLLSLYERALVFEQLEEARQYLEQWASVEPESDSKRSKLRYEYECLGDYKRAANVASASLKAATREWDKASALLSLVKLHRLAGELTLSLDAARSLGASLDSFDDWIGVGLGRMAIHEVFELAQMHPEVTLASEAFALADNWFRRSQDLAFVGMEAGARAAHHCGMADKAREYEDFAREERRRIDDML